MSGPASSRFVKAFPNWVMTLHRTTGKQSLRANEYVFRVPKEMTKFDIRQYLEKLYGVEVKTVNTVRYDGACREGRGPAVARLPRSERRATLPGPGRRCRSRRGASGGGFAGKVKMNPYTGRRYRKKEFKKAYVWLGGEEESAMPSWRL